MSRSRKAILWAVLIAWAFWAFVLAAEAVHICLTGLDLRVKDSLAPIYTQANATAAVHRSLLPLVLAAAVTIAALALGARDEGAEKPARSDGWLWEMTAARVAEPSAAMFAERRIRRVIDGVTAAGVGFFAVPLILAVLDRSWFIDTEDPLTGELILRTAPWLAYAMVLLCVRGCACRASLRREIEAARGLRHGEAPLPKAGVKLYPSFRWALLAMAAGFILHGILSGGAGDVLKKAIMICTECVGLG